MILIWFTVAKYGANSNMRCDSFKSHMIIDAHHAGRIRAQDEAVLAQVGRIAVAWAGD